MLSLTEAMFCIGEMGGGNVGPMCFIYWMQTGENENLKIAQFISRLSISQHHLIKGISLQKLAHEFISYTCTFGL